MKLFLKYLLAIVSGTYLKAISSQTGAKTQARKNLPSVMSEVGSTSNPIKRNSAKNINLHQTICRANIIKMSFAPFCNFSIVNVLITSIILLLFTVSKKLSTYLLVAFDKTLYTLEMKEYQKRKKELREALTRFELDDDLISLWQVMFLSSRILESEQFPSSEFLKHELKMLQKLITKLK